MACLPQLGSVPAAYAVIAGGCDRPLLPAVDLRYTIITSLRYVSYVSSVASLTFLTLRALRALRYGRQNQLLFVNGYISNSN